VFCECRPHFFEFKRDYSNSGDVKKIICGRSTLLSILHYIIHWGSNSTFFNISICKIIWNSKYQFMVNITRRQPIFNFNRKDQHYKKVVPLQRKIWQIYFLNFTKPLNFNFVLWLFMRICKLVFLQCLQFYHLTFCFKITSQDRCLTFQLILLTTMTTSFTLFTNTFCS
jgi:hypothetical protein